MKMKFLSEPGRIYLEDLSGATIAEIRYEIQPDPSIWNIVHTYVAPELRGQGMAEQLLDALADEARQKNVKLKPVCPYAESAFKRQDKYNDVNSEK